MASELAWPLALKAWRAPAQAARAVAEPIARLAREVAALRAELADLADLDAPWLTEEPDPLGVPINADRQPATQQEGPARRLRLASAAPSRTTDSDRAESQQGAEEAPSPVRSPARAPSNSLWESLLRGGMLSPPLGARPESAPTEKQTAATARLVEVVGMAGTTRRQIADFDDAMLIAAALRPIGGTVASGDLLERWAGLAPEVGPPEAASAAPSPSRHPRGFSSDPAYERVLPRPGEDLTGQLLAAARGETSPMIDPASPRDRTGGVPLFPPAQFLQEERAASDPAPAAAAERNFAQAIEREPALQAADLLTRLTTRWWEAHKRGGAAPSTQSATSAAALAEEPGTPGQAYASRPLEHAAFPSALAGAGRTSLEDAPAQGTAPAVQNTIHLTVQPPPGAGALDADELAELLDRILRREAQRHGIPLL